MAEITKKMENGADVVGAVLEVDGIVAVEYVRRKRTVVAAVTFTVAAEVVVVETVVVETVAVKTVTVETVAVPVGVNDHFEQ